MIARLSRIVARPMRSPAQRLKDYAANILILRKIAGRVASHSRPRVTTAQRLGFDSHARLLIVNADDFGLCGEQNGATIEGLQSGAWSSASVMVPCRGFDQVCQYARGRHNADLGVHLTLTSEWDRYRWKPILCRSKVRSLVDTDGGFWRSRAEVLSSCQPDEAEAELRAQIETALAAGIDVTHLDSHMFILHAKRKNLQNIYVRLAREYLLPLRAAARTLLDWHSFGSLPEYADLLGVLHPDNFAVMSRVRPKLAPFFWRTLLNTLPPGLTEISCHPAHAGGALARFADDAPMREADFRFFTSMQARRLLEGQQIQLVGYRMLRNAMRDCEPARRIRDSAGGF
jgi:predicted glycoside hydrolase/deacetylase ChbG (UPF0249 family)